MSCQFLIIKCIDLDTQKSRYQDKIRCVRDIGVKALLRKGGWSQQRQGEMLDCDVDLILMEEEEREGGWDGQSLRLQCSSKRVLTRPMSSPQAQSLAIGALHLAGIDLL